MPTTCTLTVLPTAVLFYFTVPTGAVGHPEVHVRVPLPCLNSRPTVHVFGERYADAVTSVWSRVWDSYFTGTRTRATQYTWRSQDTRGVSADNG